MNSSVFPNDVQQFVDQAVASGDYTSIDEVVIDAVRTLRELKSRHESLRSDIEAGIRELDAGQGEPWDLAKLKDEFANPSNKIFPTS